MIVLAAVPSWTRATSWRSSGRGWPSSGPCSFGFALDSGFQLAERYGLEPVDAAVLSPAELALAVILLGLFALGAGIVQHRMGLVALAAVGAQARPSAGGLVAFGCAVIGVLALLSVFLG